MKIKFMDMKDKIMLKKRGVGGSVGTVLKETLILSIRDIEAQ